MSRLWGRAVNVAMALLFLCLAITELFEDGQTLRALVLLALGMLSLFVVTLDVICEKLDRVLDELRRPRPQTNVSIQVQRGRAYDLEARRGD
jgi:hypothetical protein